MLCLWVWANVVQTPRLSKEIGIMNDIIYPKGHKSPN